MSYPTDWWTTFFSGLAVEFWDRVQTEDGTRKDADLVQKLLALPGGSRVLDVPCGDGRIALELVARGYKVTGIDLTQSLIDRGRLQARERGLEATLERRDMRDIPWLAAFDGAFCFGNSFGYLDDDGNAAFLESVAGALRPGGRFFLDAAVMEGILPNLEKRAWYRFGELFYLAERRYHPAEGRLESDYTFIQGDRIERKRAFYRLYTYRQLVELLEAAGLRLTGAFGSQECEPFELGSGRALLVSEKV